MKCPRLSLTVLLGVSFLLHLLAVPARASAVLEREFRYEAGRFHLAPGADGTTLVAMRGASREYTPGHPDLPLVAERVEIPVGMRLAQLRVTALETARLAAGVRVPSAERPHHDLDGVDRTPPDPAIFGSAGFVPASPVEIGTQGFERGRNVAYVIVAPTRWSPSTGELERVERVRVELVLEADAARPLERERVVPEWERDGVATAGTTRAAAGVSGAGVAAPFMATQIPSLQGSPVEYVIVTSDAMAPAFQVLADWKTASGVPAVVRTLSFIQQQYPKGADDAERIRSFIRDAYTRWGTKWILLGGDTEVIPTRLVYTTYYDPQFIATDLYYSCLEGTWNADGDSLYGEGRVSYPYASGDSCDLLPEVYVGRLPATTATDAAQLVAKTLTYERDPVSDYLQNLLFFAEVLFPQTWEQGQTPSLDGASIIESDILPIMDTVPSLHTARLYENYTEASYRPGSLPETRVTVIDSLNRGYNVAIHVGHGYRNVMHVADDNLTGADAAALTNGDRLTNLYAINCSSASIDYPCIAEALMKAPGGGTVSIVGSTRYDFPTTGQQYQEVYFQLLYQGGVNAVGELHAEQKVPFAGMAAYDGTHRWTQMTLVLLGDPELRIYTAAPRTLSVTAPATVGSGTASLPVHVETGGAPLEGARVTAYRSGDVYATGLTDAAGGITLEFQPESLGPITLTVTGHNCRPYRATVQAVAGTALALGERSVTVVDSGSGTLGNGDGYWDAGETVDLYPAIANVGSARVARLAGTLSTTDGLVTILQAAANYGALAVGDSSSPAAGLRVSLPFSADDQREVPFQLNLADSLGRTFVAKFRVTARAPELRHFRHTVIELVGDTDRIPEVGETVQYFVTLRNLGTGTANGVTAKLRCTNVRATVTDSSAAWGDIAPTADATGDAFVFHVDSAGAGPQFELVVTDVHGERLRQTLDVVAPAVPADLLGVGGQGDISLTWAHGAESDLLGYNVYRSTSSGGTYTRVNSVPTDRTSYYQDSGLAPLTRYYYKVAAVDRSGNESALSAAVPVSTNPPAHAIFPIPTGLQTPAPTLLDHLYPGHPMDLVFGSNLIFLWHPDGTYPVDADGSYSTSGDFNKVVDYYAAGLSAADLDGTGKVLIAPTWGPDRKHPPGYVFVYDLAGAPRPGWPVTLADNIWSSAAVGDVDGDGLKEIVVGSNGTTVYALRANGAELVDGDGNASTFGVFKTGLGSFNPGTAAIAPLQNDGTQSIIFGAADSYLYAWRPDASNVPGFPVKLAAGMRAGPAVADLDQDGTLEIVVPAMCDSLYVIRGNGARQPGFPVRLRMEGMSKTPSPALADMDGDGYLDIVQASTGGGIYVWNRNGVIVNAPNLTPWNNVRYSVLTAASAECSPVVADITGDGWPDVMIGDTNGQLTALSGADATVLPGFPIQLGAEVLGTPAVGDIDGDGMTEIAVVCWDKNVYVWDYDFPFSPGVAPPWPQFHHDPLRSGYALTPVPSGVGEGGGDEPAAVFGRVELGAPAPNPARGGTRLWYGVPAGRVGARLDLAIYDLFGRRVRTLQQGLAEAGRHSVQWDLRDAAGAPAGAGVYFARLATGPEACTRKVIVVR
jgi:hypothetical protein